MYKKLFILFFLPLSVLAKTITVGPGESIRYIREALRIAQPGDSILVRKGIYKEGNLEIFKSVILIGEEMPVLDGENKYEIISVNVPHVTILGFILRNSGISSIKDLAGIGGENSNYLKIYNCRFENTFFGVHISNATSCHVEGNVFKALKRKEHQTGNGIHFWKCDSMIVKNNNIQGHRDGIYFEFVSNTLIEKNTSEHNLRYGLHFMFSNDDTYVGNIFNKNGAGVAVMYSKKVTMTGNLFQENWGSSAYGLLLKDMRDSRVESNNFIRNTIGIYMEGTSRTIFTGNYFTQNGWAVKLQASCDDNIFSSNNFIANTFDLATNGSMVLNTLEFNYWDKYDGYDLDKDGVGDVPYRPVSMYSMVAERVPTAVMLWRSFLVFLLDRSEKVMPAVTPENLKDDSPVMKAYDRIAASM